MTIVGELWKTRQSRWRFESNAMSSASGPGLTEKVVTRVEASALRFSIEPLKSMTEIKVRAIPGDTSGFDGEGAQSRSG